MTTVELLTLLLGTAVRADPTLMAVASAIEAGDPSVSRVHPEDLALVDGLSLNCGRTLAAAFELSRRAAAPPCPPALRTPADVAALAERRLGGMRRECLLLIVCDASNRPLRSVTVATGAIDRCAIPVREILSAALRFDGRAFALAHNHPRGDPAPSDADIDATRAVAEAARVVGLRFLGHVVIGDRDWVRVTASESTRTPRSALPPPTHWRGRAPGVTALRSH